MWTEKHLAAWRRARQHLVDAGHEVSGQAGGWLAGDEFCTQIELLLQQVDANISLVDSDLAIQDAITNGDMVRLPDGSAATVEYDRPGRPV